MKIISPNDGYHYFFGYYDLKASQGNTHLAHRVPFFDRLPREDDDIRLGVIENGEFTPFATTTAWNFQQGALLQYHPTRADTVIYNVNENGFKTVIHNLKTGKKTYTDRACASISPDGRYGLGIDFGSVFEFRPGYGYAGAPSTEDGVWLVDLESGSSKQIIKQSALYDTGFDRSERLVVNHITFNTDSTKFLMLVRNFPKGKKWSTSLVTGYLDGSFKTILKNTTVSHYYWLDRDNIVVYCKIDRENCGLYKVNMETGAYSEYPIEYTGDIHCIISPDGNYIIGDGYPIEGKRQLWGYSLKTGVSKMLLADPSVKPGKIDIRCDLHVRFVHDGKFISFDTTRNNRREIALLPIEILDF